MDVPQLLAPNYTIKGLVQSILERLRPVVPIAVIGASLLAAGDAVRAQGVGYMRMVSASGRQMPGESTNRIYYGWIPLRDVKMPSAAEIAAVADESKDPSAGESKSVHPPVILLKDRDQSSLGLLAAMTSHQCFPEVDIVLTKNEAPVGKYKLTDATVISIRGGGTNGDTDAPVEQLRLTYAKIEVTQ